jgi:hypothetical protein
MFSQFFRRAPLKRESNDLRLMPRLFGQKLPRYCALNVHDKLSDMDQPAGDFPNYMYAQQGFIIGLRSLKISKSARGCDR